ncbi:MAG TPA: RluA family pseudouridine synthase [Planctomycetota bacterium]|nr:RluA family pseudouridine synthase [Planctomycetota bacterium]
MPAGPERVGVEAKGPCESPREAPLEVHELLNTGEPERLDVFLTSRLPEHSRAFFQRLIGEGCVTVTPLEREIKPSIKVPTGVIVRLEIPPPRKINLAPVDMPLEVLYEDDHLAVIDKPANLSVHPAPLQVMPTLVNALLHRLTHLSSIGGEERPGIVHRLDRETSGVLIVAKNDIAHHAISTQFRERTVMKTYIAVARGEAWELEGHIDAPLGKSSAHTKKQVIRWDEGGRESITDYRILKKYRGYLHLEVYPKTGRTHQIRVHLASIRMPVACDKLYGRERRISLSDILEAAPQPGEKPIIARQALHASRIIFQHPVSGESMDFRAPLPSDMQALLDALEEHRGGS